MSSSRSLLLLAACAVVALAITFRFPWRGLPTLVVDAELEGGLGGELAGEIRQRVAERITRRLNEPPQRAALQRIFHELIADGGAAGRVTTDGGGLRVSD